MFSVSRVLGKSCEYRVLGMSCEYRVLDTSCDYRVLGMRCVSMYQPCHEALSEYDH